MMKYSNASRNQEGQWVRQQLTPEIIEERFWSNVQKTATCWLWQGNIGLNGYGTMSINYKIHYAHRLAYELSKGQIPNGHQLDHLCRNRICVNPKHLESVTFSENLRRSPITNANKQFCKRGHALISENLVPWFLFHQDR